MKQLSKQRDQIDAAMNRIIQLRFKFATQQLDAETAELTTLNDEIGGQPEHRRGEARVRAGGQSARGHRQGDRQAGGGGLAVRSELSRQR